MNYIEAPTEYEGHEPSLFLAGGITECHDWQREIVELLRPSAWTVLNPRRANFPIDRPEAAEEQIRWEYRHLRRATLRLFWFPPQTLCPISLYELGGWAMTRKPLLVGVDPDYARKRDVEIQLVLSRPDVRISYRLDDLAQQAISHYPQQER